MYAVVHAHAYGFLRLLTPSPAPTKSHHCVYLHCIQYLVLTHTTQSAHVTRLRARTYQGALKNCAWNAYTPSLVHIDESRARKPYLTSIKPPKTRTHTADRARIVQQSTAVARPHTSPVPSNSAPCAYVYSAWCSRILAPRARKISSSRTQTVPGAHTNLAWRGGELLLAHMDIVYRGRT